MALEMIERLFAFVALIQCFTSRTAELADEPGIGGMALRAFDHPVRRGVRPGNRRCDPVLFQFLLPFFRHPVGGPCRGKNRRYLHLLVPMFQQCHPDVHGDHVHGGTTIVGGCDDHINSITGYFYIT